MKTVFAILLMILGIFVHKLEGVFTKKYSARHGRGGFIFTAVISLFSMLFFLIAELVTDAEGLQLELPLILFGLISGVCFATASMTMYWVLEHGPYGLSSLISSYGILVNVFHGLATGERMDILSWVGVVLICISLALIMSRKQEDKNVRITLPWLAVLVFSVLCAAAYSVLQRQQQIEFANAYDNEFMVVTLSVSALLLFIAGVIKDGKYLGEVFKHGFLLAAGGGVSNGMTNLITMLVYTLVPVSFAAPMRTGIGIVVAFLLAALVFKEKYTPRQYCGVVLGCVAMVLFNI